MGYIMTIIVIYRGPYLFGQWFPGEVPLNRRYPSFGEKNLTFWATLFLVLGLFSFASCDLGGGMGRDALGGTGGAGTGGGAGGGTGAGSGGDMSPNPGWIGSSLLLPGGTVYQTAITYMGIEPWQGNGDLVSSWGQREQNDALGTIENGVLLPVSRSEIPTLTIWTTQDFFMGRYLTVTPTEGRGFMLYDVSVWDSEESEIGILIRVVLDVELNKTQQVYYWYAEQPTRIFGSYSEIVEEGSYTVSIDAYLEAGWNRMIADITYTEEGIRIDYRTGPEPEGAIWLFIPYFFGPEA